MLKQIQWGVPYSGWGSVGTECVVNSCASTGGIGNISVGSSVSNNAVFYSTGTFSILGRSYSLSGSNISLNGSACTLMTCATVGGSCGIRVAPFNNAGCNYVLTGVECGGCTKAKYATGVVNSTSLTTCGQYQLSCSCSYCVYAPVEVQGDLNSCSWAAMWKGSCSTNRLNARFYQNSSFSAECVSSSLQFTSLCSSASTLCNGGRNYMMMFDVCNSFILYNNVAVFSFNNLTGYIGISNDTAAAAGTIVNVQLPGTVACNLSNCLTAGVTLAPGGKHYLCDS